MPRAVLDPNVLVSGLISPGGPPAQILRALRAGAFELITSPSLLAELEQVLGRPKFNRDVTGEEVAAFLELVRTESTLVEDSAGPIPRMSDDPHDDYLIALAAAVSARFLVSGDPHLLQLAEALPVVTPARFLELLERAG